MGARYRQARARERTTILNEFVALTGYRRKYAIRVLAGDHSHERPGPHAIVSTTKQFVSKRSANPSSKLIEKLRTLHLEVQQPERGEHGSTVDGTLPGACGGVSDLWAEVRAMGAGQRREAARAGQLVQWLAYTYPCQRFTPHLAMRRA